MFLVFKDTHTKNERLENCPEETIRWRATVVDCCCRRSRQQDPCRWGYGVVRQVDSSVKCDGGERSDSLGSNCHWKAEVIARSPYSRHFSRNYWPGSGRPKIRPSVPCCRSNAAGHSCRSSHCRNRSNWQLESTTNLIYHLFKVQIVMFNCSFSLN